MQNSTRISTAIFRSVVALLGLSMLVKLGPVLIKEHPASQVTAFTFILILFFGYALGFEKKLEDLIKSAKHR